MKQSRNLVAKTGLAFVLVFFAYAFLMTESGGNSGASDDLSLTEALIVYSTILSTLATTVVAALRAHRAGSLGWVIMVILFWPLSYVYCLGVNRHG